MLRGEEQRGRENDKTVAYAPPQVDVRPATRELLHDVRESFRGRVVKGRVPHYESRRRHSQAYIWPRSLRDEASDAPRKVHRSGSAQRAPTAEQSERANPHPLVWLGPLFEKQKHSGVLDGIHSNPQRRVGLEQRNFVRGPTRMGMIIQQTFPEELLQIRGSSFLSERVDIRMLQRKLLKRVFVSNQRCSVQE